MGQVDLVRLNQMMRRRGLGPTELANRAGVDPAIVTRMFRGSDPRGSTLSKIADALGVSVDYLLGRVEKPSVSESNAEEVLDSILRDHFGYEGEQVDTLRRQLVLFSPKKDLFRNGNDLAAALRAAPA